MSVDAGHTADAVDAGADASTDATTADTDATSSDADGSDGAQPDSDDSSSGADAPPIDADAAEAGPVCPMGQLLCNGVCIPNDATNCGACGHSCQGTTCSGGLCQAVTLLDNRASPANLAIDAVNLYWGESSNNGTIFACAKSGCSAGSVTGLAAGYGSGPLTVSNSLVFWIEQTRASIYVCAAAGCNNAPSQFVNNGAGSQEDIASDDASVFWQPAAIMSCPPSSSPCASMHLVASIVPRPVAPMAVSSTTVIWHSPGYQSASGAWVGSSVVDCSKSGNCRSTVPPRKLIDHSADGTNALISHIVVGSALVVAQHANPAAPPVPGPKYSVEVCPLDGCTGVPPKLWSGNDEITALAADSAGSYWAAGGTIYACPNNQCTSGAVVLASAQGTVSALVTDGTTAYFTTADSLRKVAK